MRRNGFPALVALLLVAPHAVAAQAPDSRAFGSFEASLAGTRVRESTTALAGVTGLLTLGGRLSVGAGGAVMLGALSVESVGAGSDLDLRFSYAGLVLQMTLAESPRGYVAVRTLAGAGNAKVKVPVTGPEFGADNFGVLEPELVGSVSVVGPFQVGMGVGYRHVFGVEDLPNVTSGDLRGLSARLRLSIRTY